MRVEVQGAAAASVPLPGGVVPHPVQGPEEHGAAEPTLVVGLPVVVQLTVLLLGLVNIPCSKLSNKTYLH